MRDRKAIIGRDNMFVKSRFNRLTPILKQIFCIHEWELKRDWHQYRIPQKLKGGAE